MPFRPQTRIDDAIIPDELVRLSQIGGGGGAPSFLHGGYQANTVGFGSILFTHYTSVVQTAIEADAQTAFSNACTLSRQTIHISTNTTDEATTVRTRVNGVDGNQVITIAASITGVFQDLVNTDAILSADLSNFEIDTTASTVGNFDRVGSMVEVT